MDLQNSVVSSDPFYYVQPLYNPTNATLSQMTSLCPPSHPLPHSLMDLESFIIPHNSIYDLQPQSNPTNTNLPHLSPPSPSPSSMDLDNILQTFEPFYDPQPQSNQTYITRPQMSQPYPPLPSLMDYDNFVVPFEPFDYLQPKSNPPNEILSHISVTSPPPPFIMAPDNFVLPFQPFYDLQPRSNSSNAALEDGFSSNFDVLPQNNVLLEGSASLTIQNSFQSFSFFDECVDPVQRQSHLVAFRKEMTAATKINHHCVPENKGNDKISKSPTVKGPWSQEEDRLLLRGVESHGAENWSEIAKKIHGRNGKQCRERWLNHLRPNIKKSSWSEDEDWTLFHLHSELGNKWSEIAKRLPGRTDNSIKNRSYSAKRKLLSQQQKRRPNQ